MHIVRTLKMAAVTLAVLLIAFMAVLGTAGSARASAITPANARLSSYARVFVGMRYRYGGTSVRGGFDCSGLTQFVYEHGIHRYIPRTSEEQFLHFHGESFYKAQPGDLVFFHVNHNPRSYVYHVGIYEGRKNMIAAASPRQGVVFQSFAWAWGTVTLGTITHRT